MDVKLVPAGDKDAELIWNMQVQAFSDLYKKYKDTDTNPAAETSDKVSARIMQPASYYYLIEVCGKIAGAIRIVDKKKPDVPKRISPLFVLKRYRNHGIAQKAMLEAERIHGSNNWELATILEEKGNCYLYEKMGYIQMDRKIQINDRMTLIIYKKL